jgi:DNA primase
MGFFTLSDGTRATGNGGHYDLTKRQPSTAVIDRHITQSIRDRVDVVELIGGCIELKKHGKNHKGKCPFHAEKTPSFTVSQEKGFYHCFGCGAHGDVIEFVMQYRGSSFPEAVRELAAMAGISIETSQPSKLTTWKRKQYLELLQDERLVLQIAACIEVPTDDDIQRAALAAERIAKIQEVLRHE